MSDTPNLKELKSLLEWVNLSNDIEELSIKFGDIELAMSRTPGGLNQQQSAAAPTTQTAPAPAATPAAETTPAAEPAPVTAEPEAKAEAKPATPSSTNAGVEVKSPMVGTYYASPKPGADPFVKVGDVVEVGQVLGIVEVMKLMNNIEAKEVGTVTEIFVENEEAVEHGQPLMVIEPK